MSTAALLQSHAEQEASLIDALTDAFAVELEEVLVLVNQRIRQLLRELQTKDGRLVASQANLGRLLRLRGELLDAFQQAGFTDLARDAVDAPLDRLAAVVLSHSRIAKSPARLTPQSLDAIAAFKTIRYADLLQVAEDSAVVLWRTTLDGVLGLRPVDDLVDDLVDLIDVTDTEARTLYDTAVAVFSRQANQIGSRGTDDELYFYAGPDDAKTRPFCQERVGRVFSRDEIDGMDNGMLPSVLVTAGGWNCRHTWKRVSLLDTELISLYESGDRFAA